ncbi:MAG: cryptochrome/photolyase family protein [Gammaproteobacteria bacterium]|nr:cryptochrome/photolyase family protein [Gammaproteobacteria bacterium]
MSENFFVILGNQLFDPKILKEKDCGHVFMAEDFGLCTYQKHHKLKIYLFLCAMREYRDELIQCGIKVSYFSLEERSEGRDYEDFLLNFIKENRVGQVNFFEIEDKFFEKRIIKKIETNNLKIKFHESPMFMFSRQDFISQHKDKKIFRLANFYKTGRKKFKILIDKNSNPIGDKWSFDEDNRKKIPNNIIIPHFEPAKRSKYHSIVKKVIDKNFNSHHGSLNNIWFPVDRIGVEDQLNFFLKNKINNFGIYEDAMRFDENFLFHSCISPFLNIGLITPEIVIKKVLKIYRDGLAPINSVEGFIRQVLGWREFIRGIYQMKGNEQQESNFWQHKRCLTKSWYDGSTGIVPLDDNIQLALKDGYGHHIPRLMVIANLMNLSEINPKHIYKWFMEMFIDSSDWVMVPNVFGMASFADGGLMSTKPYTCGSNYMIKMSNYKKGDWCDVVDGLYWRFIDKHENFYKSNHRLSFQTRILQRMNEERKVKIFKCAEAFLSENTC